MIILVIQTSLISFQELKKCDFLLTFQFLLSFNISSMADIDEDEFLYGDSSIEPEPQTTVAEVEQRRLT